jgi:hypothetical protein
MSDVTIISTTDSPEQVLAAHGRAAEPQEQVEVEDKPAAAESTPETLEASDTSNEEQAEEDSEAEESEEKPKKRSGIEKKIGKLTKQRQDARLEAEYWKKEALKNQTAPAAPTETKPQAADDKRPKAENFDTHEAYVEALAEHKVEQRLAQERQKAREQELKSKEQEQLKTHFDRVQKFQAQVDDFDDVIAEVGDVPMSLTVQQVILQSENGPELMYELAKDKEEYKRICDLPAIQAARELGRFESRLQASKESEKPKLKTSKAPKPISTVSRGAAVSSKDPGDMDYDEYKAFREQQLRG